MSKSITLSDLNEALKPLIEAINKAREEQLSNSTQISEAHRMLADISIKLDAVDQSVTTVSAASTRTTGKKLVGRKGAGEKKPAKRGTKKVAEPVDDVDPADDDAEPAEPADDAEPVEEDSGNVDTVEEETAVKPGKVVKKAAPKKTVAKPVKTAKATKKAAPAAPKKKQFNKMNFFKKEYEADDTQFNKVLTKKVRDKVEAEKENVEKLAGLEGDGLKKARANIYYHYLKDNNPDVLENLRTKFDAENAADTGDAEPTEDAVDEE